MTIALSALFIFPVGLEPIRIDWKDNMLTVHADIPEGKLEIWYIEAYCKGGSTDRDWKETVIPHKTELLSASDQRIQLRCRVGENVTVEHDIEALTDGVSFRLTATNRGDKFADVQWAQPCLRVGPFTGLTQEDYFRRCFLFTKDGLKRLHETQRSVKARYTPGQVYVPRGVDRNDVNPRPLSTEVPVNSLIGAISGDNKQLVAIAFEPAQELFQGVIRCIHSDFRIGGLQPGETKTVRGRLYLMENDIDLLLKRYRTDFADKKREQG